MFGPRAKLVANYTSVSNMGYCSAKRMQVCVGLYDPHYSSKYITAMQNFLL